MQPTAGMPRDPRVKKKRQKKRPLLVGPRHGRMDRRNDDLHRGNQYVAPGANSDVQDAAAVAAAAAAAAELSSGDEDESELEDDVELSSDSEAEEQPAAAAPPTRVRRVSKKRKRNVFSDKLVVLQNGSSVAAKKVTGQKITDVHRNTRNSREGKTAAAVRLLN